MKIQKYFKKNINKFYSKENKISKIVKYKEDTIIVTDDLGTIRIF